MGTCTSMDSEEIESAEFKYRKYHFKLNKVTMVDILRKTKRLCNTRYSKKKMRKQANMNAD